MYSFLISPVEKLGPNFLNSSGMPLKMSCVISNRDTMPANETEQVYMLAICFGTNQ